MWKKYKSLLLAAVLLAVTVSGAFAQEAELLDILRSDAGIHEKSGACRELARIATAESIPTLVSLLDDEQLSHMARMALEPIDDPSVDEALRAALGKLEGRPRLGVIGSLGVRRDAKSIDPLAALLKDPEIAIAAARALGNIGTQTAADALLAALPGTTGSIQKAVCEGLFRCAESLAEEGGASQAIYDRVRELTDAPHPIRAAALRGAILSRGADGVPLIAEAVSGPDYGQAAAAIRAAMELPGKAVTDALLAELPNVSAERKSLLILALADRNDPRVLPAVLDVMKSSEGTLRIVAFRALRRVGDASCVPVLLDAAQSDDNDVSQAAIDSLENLQGETVDAQLITELSQAEGKTRLLLIELIGRRRAVGAKVTLWQAADDEDSSVRGAALNALGAISEASDLPKLIGRLAAAENTQEAATLDKAISSVCLRAADREAVATQLATAMSAASIDGSIKVRILEILTVVGGKTALDTIATAARSGDDALCDAATRLLGTWKSADAAPTMLQLYETIDQDRYKIRLIRSYIRIARQFDMPIDQRAAMCRTALAAAERDADKQLVLEVLLRYPSEQTQAIALEASKIPALKEQALLVVMGMSSQGINRAELGKALAEAGQKPVKLEIIKAVYGAGEKSKDVTDVLRKYAKNYRIIFLPSSSYNTSFGGDPAPLTPKQLIIKYRVDGKEGQVTLGENSMIVLPAPQ